MEFDHPSQEVNFDLSSTRLDLFHKIVQDREYSSGSLTDIYTS